MQESAWLKKDLHDHVNVSSHIAILYTLNT